MGNLPGFLAQLDLSMIKRILVALDPDSDTPVATRYAAEIARRHDAEIIGLGVVDTGSIEAGARGGGIGSMYYAEKLRENLTEETHARARQLIREFEEAAAGHGVRHRVSVEEGVPFQRIVEDMKYHDLLLVGREPHFFYGHPEQKTKTLAKVVKLSTAPALVVSESYSDIKRVLIAYDGSDPTARTVHNFAHLMPFGHDVAVEVIHMHDGNERESELMLRLISEYLGVHGFETRTMSMRGNDPAEQIVDYARELDVDLVVAGAHSMSRLKEWAFGSTTSNLLASCPIPMFVYH